mgnify:CR=1 FL=1
MISAAARSDHPEILFAKPTISADRRTDGSIILKSTTPLKEGARCVGHWLEHWARQTPERIFLGDRASADMPWRTVTLCRRVAAGPLGGGLDPGAAPERGTSAGDPCRQQRRSCAVRPGRAACPACPRRRSQAYSLMSKDFDKLKGMIKLLGPGAIFVSSTKTFAAALAAIAPLHSARIVSSDAGDAETISFRSIAATPETPDVAKAFAAITPDTIAKFLFTSGSTGTPKAVINTQRMLTSSQQAKAQTWAFLDGISDLVILDWLPWSHTFGANHNFNLVLRNGGSALYRRRQAGAGAVCDFAGQSAQRDADGLFQRAARFRHADRGLARRRRTVPEILQRGEVRLLCRRGAAADLWDGLEELSIKTSGRALPMVVGLEARPKPRRWRPIAISRPNVPAISACRSPAPN